MYMYIYCVCVCVCVYPAVDILYCLYRDPNIRPIYPNIRPKYPIYPNIRQSNVYRQV